MSPQPAISLEPSPNPWNDTDTLVTEGRQAQDPRSVARKQRILLNNGMTLWDVCSLKIPAQLPDNLGAIELTSGCRTFISLSLEMLRTLPVSEGQIEILTPFMPYLPLSSLAYHEMHVVWMFDSDDLPTVGVQITRCWPPARSIPFRQPYGTQTFPNSLLVSGGMAMELSSHGDRPYGRDFES